MFFRNGPEYEARLNKPFMPPKVTLKEIHDAVPKHLFYKNHTKATLYLLRDITFTLFLYHFAYFITPWAASDFGGCITSSWQKAIIKSSLWIFYWWFQGIVSAGVFCLGHDAGHASLYSDNKINNTVGFVLHSYLLIPYFSWRITHHAHHKATASIERDENYVPYTRSQFKFPEEKKATRADYTEVFEETPLYTFFRLFIMQGFGWWIYLTQNTMGSPMYPPGTNHFNPNSPLFKSEHRTSLHFLFFSDSILTCCLFLSTSRPGFRFTQNFNLPFLQGTSIILSNIGLGVMGCFLFYMGREFFLWYYLIPYLMVNHWIVMFTFLHHSDPTIPHYRKPAWTFLRGAVATVDRPLLGWMGRFFFHNISHDHVAHHLFLRAPFYNGPEITKVIKRVLKDDYNYDSTPTFYSLYRSFTQCQFIEDEGDILFYKNKEGKAVREIHPSVAIVEEVKGKAKVQSTIEVELELEDAVLGVTDKVKET